MTRSKDNPFDIFNGRAMISLGPLTSNKHCPYSCLFCYVPNGFLQYESIGISKICEYLRNHEDDFEIVYISGDTDSFAPPRLQEGLELLETVANKFNKDILITTRMAMDADIIERLQKISKLLLKKNRKFFVCISISSPDGNQKIEPPPIPSIASRIDTMTSLKKNGIYSILALRPFLPIYSSEDYIRIINLLKDSVDVILGEVWYHDINYEMWRRLTGSNEVNRGVSKKVTLPFNISEKEWEEWRDSQMEKEIADYCRNLNIPFFMDSSSAIKYLNTKVKTT